MKLPKCLNSNIHYTNISPYHYNFKSIGGFPYSTICPKNKGPFNMSYKSRLTSHWTIVNQDLVKVLTNLNRHLDEKGMSPIVITSWHRDPSYNHSVNGVKCSRHISGEAVDIKHRNIDYIQNYLENKFSASCGIGRYEKYPYVLHFDVRKNKARW